jgi:uncharacterized protein YndB with AHSA1/START domain
MSVVDGRRADYVVTAAARATPADVFGALTTGEGIAGWWTGSVDGAPGLLGGLVTLRFAGLAEHIVLRVKALDPGRAVEWTCAAHTGHREWEGTSIEFALRVTGDGCSVTLRHRGLTPALACFEACARGWDFFVPSLIRYVETGAGSPFRSASTTSMSSTARIVLDT